jgi:aconitate hydratase
VARRQPREVSTRDVVELDLASIEPALAGPKRPQDRMTLRDMKEQWHRRSARCSARPAPSPGAGIEHEGDADPARRDVVIAAITSCTNTSNPEVMIGAGLLARKAVAPG